MTRPRFQIRMKSALNILALHHFVILRSIVFLALYMLYLRCCPDVVDDYNFYVYAYDKQMLMKTLAEERGLPLYCYGYLPTTGEEIRIDFATSGYTPYRKLKSDKDVKEINREIGVTPAQAEAMKVGSMFGWNVPGADPKSYDEKGKPIPPRSGGER